MGEKVKALNKKAEQATKDAKKEVKKAEEKAAEEKKQVMEKAENAKKEAKVAKKEVKKAEEKAAEEQKKVNQKAEKDGAQMQKDMRKEMTKKGATPEEGKADTRDDVEFIEMSEAMDNDEYDLEELDGDGLLSALDKIEDELEEYDLM